MDRWRPALRWRLAIVAVAALLIAVVDQGEGPFDTLSFIRASRTLFSAHALDVFADRFLQVGPVQLVFCWLLAGVADLLHVDYTVVFGPVIEVASVLTVVLTLRRLRSALARPPSPAIELAVGLVFVAWDLASSAYLYGHQAQVAIPLLWLLAAVEARAGRWQRAGVLVGLSAGIETWGVLGLPLLLAHLRPRDAVRSGALASVISLAWYAPFALFGTFRTGDFRWRVTPVSVLARWVTPGTTIGWGLRIGQGAAALAVASLVAVVLRRRPHALWVVPLAALVVRLALDPVNFSYYWVAPQTIALVGVGLLARESRRGEWVAALSAYAVLLVEEVDNLAVVALVLLGIAVSVAVDRRSTSRLEPAGVGQS